MYFLALALDFDGTIADRGVVAPSTLSALRQVRQSGRKVLLVTGRELGDLRSCFPELDLFDVIVAENGALLFEPGKQRETLLAPSPPDTLLQALADRNVKPLSVGRSIIATWRPQEKTVMETIEDLGLEMQIIFNKGAVMILPTGVNKASGLRNALKNLGISPLNVVGVGDAENDHAFLKGCGCAVAVANALPALKKAADIVLAEPYGAGVAELVERLVDQDKDLVSLSRRGLLAGQAVGGDDVFLDAGELILVIGNSGCGKSNYVTWLTEQMVARGFEFCLIDPEGDYVALEDAATIGTRHLSPDINETLRLLVAADVNVVVNAQVVKERERRDLLATLLPEISRLRAVSGRPHWLVADEAHYLLPQTKEAAQNLGKLTGAIVVSVHPSWIHSEILAACTTVIAMGNSAIAALDELADILRIDHPVHPPTLEDDEFLIWAPQKTGQHLVRMKQQKPRQIHHRHSGKYATGDVGDYRSFYFRGPRLDVNQKARNLSEFVKLGAELSDEVWQHHLSAGDYSRWFRFVIRDDVLAREAEIIEQDNSVSAAESRDRLFKVVHARYVIPVEAEA
jgi:hydroxymethylpyrimidine pyrophosphatase-like HAD family hydrolase